jgi:ATP-binding cassette subfamily D (ALD) long-chain fatty acid import protein
MTDYDLMAVLDTVRLAYLPVREGGWDTKKEWKDVLSGGEKQRISLARIIYHSPAFAVLDEPTSAVSSDVEGLLYSVCKERGITLVTLSTRASLKKYHTFQLSLDGHGGWVVERIGGDVERSEVERELEELRSRVLQVQGKRERLEAVQAELGKVWVHGGGELAIDSDVSEEIVVGGESEMGESFAEVKEGDVVKSADLAESYADVLGEAADEAGTSSLTTSTMSESFADDAASKVLGESYDDVSGGANTGAQEAEVKEGESYADAIKTV